MKPFDYYAPTSLDEALRLMAGQNGRARVLAGGTDLLLKMRAGRTAPGCLINVKRTPELRGLRYDAGQGLRLGALATLSEIMASPDIGQHYPSVAQAAATMAGVQVRNLATVGGNLCNAAPSADLAPPLIALGAQVHIAGARGRRSVALEDFFTGPGQTVLASDELLVALTIPAPDWQTAAVYLKHAPREAMDIAIVGVAAALTFDDGVCASAKIVLGAVAPTPLRARQAEQALADRPLDEARIREAARLAAEEARPIDDTRASAWYRREMVEVLTRRALLTLKGNSQ
jgi:carbon-monoxide dehydrogenase medium subunit